MLVYFYSRYFSPKSPSIQAKSLYTISRNTRDEFDKIYDGQEYTEDFCTLKSYLKGLEVSVPTLYKQYGELSLSGGVNFFDFGINPDFNNSVDAYLMVDLDKLKDEKRRRYISHS